MNEDEPWIAHGSETAEHEDFLVGNRAGLEALKQAVEQALRDGQSLTPQPGIEYIGIRVVETDPRKPTPHTFGDKLKMVGCLVLLLICVFIFFVGLHALPTLFR
jgi:hypothetical protein